MGKNKCEEVIEIKMEKEGNPLLCDIETGFCGTLDDGVQTDKASNTVKSNKKINVLYFTDPICSSCWGIEPQLRKLKLEYGDAIAIEYRMGGLLPNWSYNSGGISKPADVASHWDHASLHYDMPIDGDLWLEDPLQSSYPPSIAFKAAQMQSEEKALLFLRKIKEMVFLHKNNIARWENLEMAAKSVGLEVTQLKADFESEAEQLFEEDLNLAKKLGVRGFPTIFFTDGNGNQETVYGSKPYVFYEMAILKMNPNAVKKEYSKNWQSLFAKFPTMTVKEFSELSGMPRMESEKLLDNGTELQKFETKNGALYSISNV